MILIVCGGFELITYFVIKLQNMLLPIHKHTKKQVKEKESKRKRIGRITKKCKKDIYSF